MSISSTLWVTAPTSAISGSFELWAIGENSQGECGVGTTTDVTTWTKIGSAQNWASVACGKNHTLALKKDGTLWAWGDNSLNQLGDGTTTDSTVPKQIGTDTTWYMIGCTDNGSFALKASGNSTYPLYLYRWGKPVSTYSGTIATPTQWITTLGSSPNVSYIEKFDCGRDHIMMLTANRRVYYGGTTASLVTDPVTTAPYGPQPDWCQDVSAGAYHTNYYRRPNSYSTYQRGIWGDGDANRGTPSSSGTPTFIVAGSIIGNGINSSGTATMYAQPNGPSAAYLVWGTLSNNADYQSRTSLLPVGDYTGTARTHTASIWPAGNDVFRRRITTGRMSQATILPTNSASTFVDLPSTIDYTFGFAGFAESGATSRRLIALKYPIPQPSFTVSTTNNVATVTNTSTDSLTYMIDWGDGSTTNITAGPGTPGGGTISHTYTPSTDTVFTITLYAYGNQLDGVPITRTATDTSKGYATQSPTFTIVSSGAGPTATFLNTSPNTLGHTAIFGAGNKWRWEWGDTTTTDVNVGAGAAGDISIPITHTYTFTAGQILAGVPVTFTVTLKAYNGNASSPFSSASQSVTVIPANPNFPNRVFTTLDDANIPDIIKVKTTQVWGVTGGGNT
jgi:hypothetical protein